MFFTKSKIHNILRWSEKYTKTDMVYLAHGGFWFTLGQIISSASAFLLTIAFANFLPKETFGTYKYVLSFVGVLSVMAIPGVGTAIARSVAIGKEGSFIPALKTKIKWGFSSAFFSFILAGYYYVNDNISLAISFALIGIFIPLLESFGVYSNYLQGKKFFKSLSKYDIFSQLIASGVIVITVFFTNNLFILLLVYLAIWTLVRFIYLKRTLINFPPNNQIDPQTINYGKHLSLMNIIGTISANLDKILIWKFLGAVQVATYFLALAIPTHINGLLKIANRLAFPKLAKKNIDEIKNTLLSKIIKFSGLSIIIILLYAISAPFIYKIFFPKYTEAIFYSQIFSITILMQPIALISSMLTAHARKKELYFINIISPSSKILLMFFLIPQFGILGAIFALIGSKILDSIVLIYMLKK